MSLMETWVLLPDSIEISVDDDLLRLVSVEDLLKRELCGDGCSLAS